MSEEWVALQAGLMAFGPEERQQVHITVYVLGEHRADLLRAAIEGSERSEAGGPIAVTVRATVPSATGEQFPTRLVLSTAPGGAGELWGETPGVAGREMSVSFILDPTAA